jgi:hypothetical protein
MKRLVMLVLTAVVLSACNAKLPTEPMCAYVVLDQYGVPQTYYYPPPCGPVVK